MTEKKTVVAEFESELEAEIAKGHLEAAGIDVSLVKDDAGGMLPSLQQTEGVRLLVDEKKEVRAREILAEHAS